MIRLFGRPNSTPPPPTALDAVENRDLLSIGDPAFAAYFGLGVPNYTGVTIGETTALSISAVWRAVSLISGTIASLRVGAVQENEDGSREWIPSWLDSPGGPGGPTRFEFWETVLVHLLLHGNAYLLHIRNGGGGLAGLYPIHPCAVSVERAPDSVMKTYRVTLDDGTVREFTDFDLLHIPAMSTDGIRGMGPIQIARNSLGIAIAADRAAGRMFSQGAFLSGMVTPEEDVSEDEAKSIKASLDANVSGWDNAGTIAVINRKLKFTQWSMSNEDAQFLQSRQFQIEEIARWYGVPPYELMQTEKQTSWGTGIEAQQRGLARQVLGPWTERIEQRVSRLLPTGRCLEFDFHELEKPTPEAEVSLLIQQVGAGIMTTNEARAIRKLPPIEGGDVLREPGSAQQAPQEVPA